MGDYAVTCMAISTRVLWGAIGVLTHSAGYARAPASADGVLVMAVSPGAGINLYPELLAQAPPDLLRPTAERVEPWWTPRFRNIGFGVGGAGVVTAGLGAYFGLQAESKRDSVKRDAGLSQQDALTRHRHANIRIGSAVSEITVDSSTGAFKSWPLPVGEGLLKLSVRAPGYRETTEVVSKEASGNVKSVTL